MTVIQYICGKLFRHHPRDFIGISIESFPHAYKYQCRICKYKFYNMHKPEGWDK